MWKMEMKESGSVLHYDNVAWNVLDINGKYVFTMGNTQGVAKLATGRKAEEVAAMLEGIPCRGSTSCPDQLAKAIKAYHD